MLGIISFVLWMNVFVILGKKLFGRSHTHKVAQSRARTLAEYLKALIKMPEKIMTSMCVLDFFDANAADIKPISEQEREKQPTSLIKRIIPSSSETPKPKDIDVGDGENTSWMLCNYFFPSSPLSSTAHLCQGPNFEVKPFFFFLFVSPLLLCLKIQNLDFKYYPLTHPTCDCLMSCQLQLWLLNNIGLLQVTPNKRKMSSPFKLEMFLT